MAKPVGIASLRKPQLVDALQRVQHFCPPRPTRQDKAELVRCVWRAIRSERYCVQMAYALRDVGYDKWAGLIPPQDDSGKLIIRGPDA